MEKLTKAEWQGRIDSAINFPEAAYYRYYEHCMTVCKFTTCPKGCNPEKGKEMLYVVDDFSGMPVASFDNYKEMVAFIEKARSIGNQDVSSAEDHDQAAADEHSRRCGGCDLPGCHGPA